MEKLQRKLPETPESVWAGFHELRQIMKKNELKAEKSRIEAEKSRIEAEKSRIEADKRMKKLEELMGSWATNHGFFAEEYFVNSFEQNKRNFFGEKFEELEKNVKGIKKDNKDEYDILLINGKSVGIVEVKFKAHEKDIPKILRKAQTYRVNFPEYQNHQIYLGLATMSFYPELERECNGQGIAKEFYVFLPLKKNQT